MPTKPVLDKEGEELLASIEGTQPETASPPRHTNQVLFMKTNMTAPAGGQARGRRDKPAGTRFNHPTADDLERYAASAGEREEFIANDPIVRAASTKDELVLLNTLKQEVAREAAALAYQRRLNEQMGRDISQVSSRRIDAIKKIADIELEMRKIGIDQIDVYGEKFQRIYKLWIETIQGIAAQMLTPEQNDLFFNRLSTEMDGWEDKAADLVR